MKLGEKIKQLREEKELTQEQFGKNFNVAKQTVSGWEKDVSDPSLPMLCKIADYFDVSTDYLLGRLDEFGNKIKIKK